jgi:hypothetical protein
MDRVREFNGDVIAAARHSAEQGIPTCLLHVVNDASGWGAGFSGVLSRVYPKAESQYRAWANGKFGPSAPRLELGQVQFVPVQSNLVVLNCCAQHGYSKPNAPAFRLDSFRLCLRRAVKEYPDFDFYLPKVGSGLGGGHWFEIATVLQAELQSVPFVGVYSLVKSK